MPGDIRNAGFRRGVPAKAHAWLCGADRNRNQVAARWFVRQRIATVAASASDAGCPAKAHAWRCGADRNRNQVAARWFVRQRIATVAAAARRRLTNPNEEHRMTAKPPPVPPENQSDKG